MIIESIVRLWQSLRAYFRYRDLLPYERRHLLYARCEREMREERGI